MGRRTIVKVGDKIGKLTITNVYGGGAGKYKMCDVICECGKEYIGMSSNGVKRFKGGCCRVVKPTCKQCGREFETSATYQVYCSKECARLGYNAQKKAYKEEWSDEKLDRDRKRSTEHRIKNRDKIREKKRAYYLENRVKINIKGCYRKTFGSVNGASEKDIIMNSIAIAFCNKSNRKNIEKTIEERVKYAESRNLFR